MPIAEAVLNAHGNRGRRGPPATGWAGLTPAEEKVVAHAVYGLTNPQIASRLFIGSSTVTTHRSHAFDKLGVANRTELATAALRRATG